jgi:hypothetical protein
MKVWFIRKVHDKIQIYKKHWNKTDNKTWRNQKKKSEMKFDLWQIIIWNDFGIVMLMITKIPILHKPIPMKHCHGIDML